MNINKKKYQIIYNTQSKSDFDRWILICEGEEFLVSNIIIDSHTKTTKDFIGGLGNKYHITCEGYLEIENNIAHIQVKRVDNAVKRHIYKTVTYRLLSSLIGFFVIFLITGSTKAGGVFSIAELLYKPLQYYFHERVWYKFGKLRN